MDDIELELQLLFKNSPLVKIYVHDTHWLVDIQNRKEKLITHEVLTWRLKSRAIRIEQGDANTIFFSKLCFG